MRYTFTAPIVLTAIVAWIPTLDAAPSAPEGPLAQLDEALKAAATFVDGSDAGPLHRIERLAAEALKDPVMREAVEDRLIRALRAEATIEARSFFCRQLRTIGTGRSIPVLEGLLPYRDLSHMARYALERIEDPEAAARRKPRGSTEASRRRTGRSISGSGPSAGSRPRARRMPCASSSMRSGIRIRACARMRSLWRRTWKGRR